MSEIVSYLREIEDYVAFCRAWGIPLQFSRADRASLEEIEALAREYLKQRATSQPQPVVEITEDESPW